MTTLVTRLGRRLLRAAWMTESPRDVTFVALDIVGYGRRDSDRQAGLRQRLFAAVKVIRQALGHLISYDVLDRGDGVLILLPGETDVLRVLNEALPRLAARVGEDNRAADGHGKMILRCVLHRGQARRDRWGWVGEDVNLVFRLLDSRTLKLRLRRDQPSPLTVALSEALYRDACAQIADEQTFQNSIKSTWHDALTAYPFRAKEIEQTAWIASVAGS